MKNEDNERNFIILKNKKKPRKFILKNKNKNKNNYFAFFLPFFLNFST